MDKTSSSDLTDSQLKLSYWYVTHKLSLRRAWRIFVIVVVCLIWSYIIWQLVIFGMTYKSLQQNIQTMLFSPDMSLSAIEKSAPQPLSISDMNVLGSNNEYNYLVQVNNSNNNWLAQFQYRFTTPSSTEQDFHSGFVLPGDHKYLMDLSKASPSASLEIRDMNWSKVNKFELTQNKMSQFIIDNIDITKPSNASDPTKVYFTIKNDSAYSYWEVDLQVLLMSNGSIVGINHIILNSFRYGENRGVNILWNNPVSNVDSAIVIPNLNILDGSNVMPLSQ